MRDEQLLINRHEVSSTASAVVAFREHRRVLRHLLLLVVLWLPTIFLISSVDRWQLVLNTVVSVLAFALAALLQNSERRNDVATHRKLDAIAAGLADLMQHEIDRGSGELETRVEDLRRAVGLEERV